MVSDQPSLNSGTAVVRMVFILQHPSHSKSKDRAAKAKLDSCQEWIGRMTSGILLDANVLNSVLKCGFFRLALQLAAMLYSF